MNASESLAVFVTSVSLVLATAASSKAQLTPLDDAFFVSEGSSFLPFHPAVTASGSGSFVVAWVDRGISGPMRISRRLVQPTGPAPGEIITVTSSLGGDLSAPALASDLEGNAALAWRLRGGEGGECINGVLLDPTGAPRTSLQPVADIAAICPESVTVSMERNRMAGLVWDRWNGTITDLDIFFQAFNEEGSFFGPPINLSDDGFGQVNLGPQLDPDIDSNGDGNTVAVWINEGQNIACSLCARRILSSGGAVGEIVPLAAGGAMSFRRPRVAVGPSPGSSIVVWERLRSGAIDSEIVGILLDPAGHPVTEPILISATEGDHKLPAVSADAAGNVVVAWRRERSKVAGAPALPPAIFARLLTRFAVPRGPEIQVSQEAGPALASNTVGPDVAFGANGIALVVWRSEGLAEQELIAGRGFVTDLTPSCSESPQILCLLNDRFQVEVEWKDFQSRTGRGTVVPTASNKSGLFWFFREDNWELMVKMLDGCLIGNHYWIFAAGTTNVEYTLTVTDTLSGRSTQYFNPLGQPSSTVTDTMALEVCP